MHPLHALILGIVEGISEFLPISSTGHLILASKLLHIAESDVVKSFEIFIQLGAILAVTVLYWRRLLLNRDTFFKVIVAFLPTAVIGLIVHGMVKKYLLGNVDVVLWSLFLGGLFLILFEQWHPTSRSSLRGAGREPSHTESNLSNVSYKQAVALGFFQSIAIIPGVSRSASTIVGGLLMGLNRRTIVDFSFLLAIPTMAAATGLDLMKSYKEFGSSDVLALGIGFWFPFFNSANI